MEKKKKLDISTIVFSALFTILICAMRIFVSSAVH